MSDSQAIPPASRATPRYLALCKRDALGRVEQLAAGERVVARRVACGGSIPASAWLARVLLRRERRALQRLAGLSGVPTLVEDRALSCWPSPPECGGAPRAAEVSLRSWCSGEPLHRATSLPADFFDRLDELVGELHARGVCHNDLHKEQNVMVAADGYPALIDFQLASLHRLGSYLHRVRSRDDLRHIEKHRRRYTRDGRGPRELELGGDLLDASGPAQAGRGHAIRRSPVAFVWRRLGKPLYVFVTRVLLRTRDGEERRPSSGPWPSWTAPVGSRASSAR